MNTPLLLYNLVVFFENVNNSDFTKSLPILDTCSIAMNFAKKSDCKNKNLEKNSNIPLFSQKWHNYRGKSNELVVLKIK